MLQCVSKKFKPGDFSGLSFESMGDKKRMTPMEYYLNLGTAMFGLAIPGIGYDTYRSTFIHTFIHTYIQSYSSVLVLTNVFSTCSIHAHYTVRNWRTLIVSLPRIYAYIHTYIHACNMRAYMTLDCDWIVIQVVGVDDIRSRSDHRKGRGIRQVGESLKCMYVCMYVLWSIPSRPLVNSTIITMAVIISRSISCRPCWWMTSMTSLRSCCALPTWRPCIGPPSLTSAAWTWTSGSMLSWMCPSRWVPMSSSRSSHR